MDLAGAVIITIILLLATVLFTSVLWNFVKGFSSNEVKLLHGNDSSFWTQAVTLGLRKM
jgi:hypothetical protein